MLRRIELLDVEEKADSALMIPSPLATLYILSALPALGDTARDEYFSKMSRKNI